MQGTIVELTLDLEKREIRYKFDEDDYGAVFTDIEVAEYRAAVTGYAKMEIEII